jgi:hypothetical protein
LNFAFEKACEVVEKEEPNECVDLCTGNLNRYYLFYYNNHNKKIDLLAVEKRVSETQKVIGTTFSPIIIMNY